MTLTQVDWILFAKLASIVLGVGLTTGLCIPSIKMLIRIGGWTVVAVTSVVVPRDNYEMWLAWLPIILALYLVTFAIGFFGGAIFRGYLSRHKMRRPQFL